MTVATKITSLQENMVALENLAPFENLAPAAPLRIQHPPQLLKCSPKAIFFQGVYYM